MKDDELRQALAATRPLLRVAAAFGVVAALLVLTPSWYMLEMYDRVVGSRSHGTLAMLTLLVVGAFIVMEVLEWSAAMVLHGAGLRFEAALAKRTFDACFTASLRRLPAGGAQPLQDLAALRDFFAGPAVRAAIELPVALVFLALVFAIHPVLGWVTLAGGVAQALVAWCNERATHRPLLAANRVAREAQQQAEASLRNAEVIAAMGMLGAVQARWASRQQEHLGLQAAASDRAGTWQGASRFLQTTLASALLGLAAWLALRGDLHDQGGLMVVSSILGGRVLAPIGLLVAQWRSVVHARDAWTRLGELLRTVPPRHPGMAMPRPTGRLDVENLVVPVPGSPAAILKGVAFTLAPGQVLAVIGPSAGGKTTLARALVGLWPSTGGKVRLDGADVFAWDKGELGPCVGYLPQGVELFDGTVADNIARFGEVDDAKVEAAARKVGLHEFILGLPAAYRTEIGSEGARLSGGQRQRLALARALYGDPVFVVLDEPNASLDEAGDKALATAIANAKTAGTTFVVMTHRASVLAVADRILVLADGQVQACGPRDEVLAAMQRPAAARPAPRQATAPVAQEIG